MNFLDLPIDITLQIIGEFRSVPVIEKDGLYNTFQREWKGLAAIQACRLTCRALNELVSCMLCPMFRGGLERKTMERIKNLSKNKLIAEGMRAVEINLAFRPRSIAKDVKEYFEFAAEKVYAHGRHCDWDTEFEEFEDDDESPEALEYRALLAAKDMFRLIERSWRQLANPKTRTPEDFQGNSLYQQIFKDCFQRYGMMQEEEDQIVADGTFVQAIAEAMAQSSRTVFLSFIDSPLSGTGFPKTLAVARDPTLLTAEILEPHDWLKAEERKFDGKLLPARILVELPIACERLGAPLQGLHIGCFPLTKAFTCLLPQSCSAESLVWRQLSSSCRNLKYLQFGKRGMNSTPYRKGRIAVEHCTIIDAYIGALCSAPELVALYICMTPFRVCDPKPHSIREIPAADIYYEAGNILRMIGSSSSLKRIGIQCVEISGSDLECFLNRLPESGLRAIRLCSVTLHSGGFVSAVEILKSRKLSSINCSVDLSSLQGGEFGPPQGFRDYFRVRDKEERDSYLDRMQERMRPLLLRQATAYICGDEKVNPLLSGDFA
jgi:hypothetical protein